MNGTISLLILILSAALPVVIALISFRLAKFPVSYPRFFLFLLGGILSVFIASFLQVIFPETSFEGIGDLFFRVFVRIALTEELGRFIVLLVMFSVLSRRRGGAAPGPSQGAAAGLIAGLGFAFAENASYAVADIRLVFVRALTAAPLHGACGSRVGLAAVNLRNREGRSLSQFLAAVIIHGMYNLFLINPRIPAFVPVLLAFSALASAIFLLRRDPE